MHSRGRHLGEQREPEERHGIGRRLWEELLHRKRRRSQMIRDQRK